MASLSRDRNGTKRVLFVDKHGERRTVRLGDMTVKEAETWQRRIKALNFCAISGTAPDPELSAWISERGEVMHERLARVGLVAPRSNAATITLETS